MKTTATFTTGFGANQCPTRALTAHREMITTFQKFCAEDTKRCVSLHYSLPSPSQTNRLEGALRALHRLALGVPHYAHYGVPHYGVPH